ncbi:MAG: LytTR family DNA-binding domain-containing protein [Enterococcaceae bacterium]|jgi:DNA-binding LytR/AlgR family response regulator|nr:LytTR family DNA-binding domain-containing protein [Enterococcaceae bacterium]
MIKVAICEDNVEQLAELVGVLSSLHNGRMEIDEFDDGTDLLKYLEKNPKYYQVYFFDIEMQNSNGVEVAKNVRKMDTSAIIVFVTSYTEYMRDVFDVLTFDYIVKPFKKSEIEKVYHRILEYYKTSDQYFSFSQKRVSHVIQIDQIYYFEKQGRSIEIVTTDNVFQTNLTIGEVLSQLDETRFARINSGIIVNLSFVRKIEGSDLYGGTIITDEFILPISRRFKSGLKSKMVTFFKGRM